MLARLHRLTRWGLMDKWTATSFLPVYGKLKVVWCHLTLCHWCLYHWHVHVSNYHAGEDMQTRINYEHCPLVCLFTCLDLNLQGLKWYKVLREHVHSLPLTCFVRNSITIWATDLGERSNWGYFWVRNSMSIYTCCLFLVIHSCLAYLDWICQSWCH